MAGNDRRDRHKSRGWPANDCRNDNVGDSAFTPHDANENRARLSDYARMAVVLNFVHINCPDIQSFPHCPRITAGVAVFRPNYKFVNHFMKISAFAREAARAVHANYRDIHNFTALCAPRMRSGWVGVPES